MNLFTAFLSGLLFASGLVLSGMVMPAKVLAFLDVAGDFDPTLAFVMGGALAVYAPLSARILKTRPVALPKPGAAVDARLLTGAALFGIGWGLAGLCPGPAIVVAGTLSPAVLVFVASMVVGAYGFQVLEAWRSK